MFILTSPNHNIIRPLRFSRQNSTRKIDYTILFNERNDANKVNRYIGEQPSMKLYNIYSNNVLRIMKNKVFSYNYYLNKLTLDETVDMHMRYNTGLLMTRELIDEDRTSMSFSCSILEPDVESAGYPANNIVAFDMLEK